MQQLLRPKDSEAPQEMGNQVPSVSLWSRSGPVLLLAAFALLLFKAAPFYWPVMLTAFLGYAATRLLKFTGLALSLIALAAVSYLTLRTNPAALWTCLIAGSIALSLGLIYLGGKDAESIALGAEEKIRTLDETIKKLEKQLRDVKGSITEENRKSLAEQQRLNALYSETTVALNQTKQALVAVEHQHNHLADKCASLSQEIITHQNNAITLYHSYEEAKTQVEALKTELAAEQLKNQTPKEVIPSIIEQEEAVPEENPELEQVQAQYALLRQQFEEKSEALHLARKELFKMENDYLALQKSSEERARDCTEEDLALAKDLKAMEEECRDLELQVGSLQDFITALLAPKAAPKKRTRVKKDKSEEEDGLPELIQNKIDQRTSV